MKVDSNFNENNELTNLIENEPHKIKTNKGGVENNSSSSKGKEIKYYPKKNNYICQKKRNTYIITVDQKGNPIITVGPEWIFFAFFILFITGGFSFLLIGYYKYMQSFIFIPGLIIYLTFIFVYTKLFITNPGFAENITEKKENETYLYCNVCDIRVNKKSKTMHCSKCGMCVEQFNHHCDWIGKCIGKNNLYYFYFLIIWIFIMILYYVGAFIIAHDNWFEYKRYLKRVEREKNRQN